MLNHTKYCKNEDCPINGFDFKEIMKDNQREA